MIICAVQLQSIPGDLAANVARHLDFIQLAVNESVDLIFFPELSLTGYEPQLARSLATVPSDRRLDVFEQRSNAHNVVIGLGLPLAAEDKARIGMVWFTPHAARREYSKQQLHSDELPFFVPGSAQLVLQTTEHTLVPAICFESLQPNHAKDAANLGADVYLASVAKSTRGMAGAALHYPAIAVQHRLHLIVANCIGPCDNFVGAGRSATWNNRGELLAQMDGESEGMVIYNTREGQARVVSAS